MSTLFANIPMLIVLVFFAVTFMLLRGQSLQRLEQWLASQGYEEVRFAEVPPFRPGPFFMLNKRGWGVKRLTVRQASGQDRSGWIMYPAGLFVKQMSDQEDQVKLVWDDEWDPTEKPRGQE